MKAKTIGARSNSQIALWTLKKSGTEKKIDKATGIGKRRLCRIDEYLAVSSGQNHNLVVVVVFLITEAEALLLISQVMIY